MADTVVGQTRGPISAVVAGGATTSPAIDIGGHRYVGIIVPAEFDGTTITFTVCGTVDGTYMPLEVAAGTAVSFTTNASSAFSLGTEIIPWRFFKIVCGTAQTGATTFLVVTKS
ncbi:MAG TPA: hypothetical protein VLA89_06730 [Gemmatimonadales bacterium]|nr:hypothetical protein [Gemmatimonadales bacterium]